MQKPAPPLKQRSVRLPENEEVTRKLLEKHRAKVEQPDGLPENLNLTLSTAYHNVCDSKEPIRTLEDLSLIKYIYMIVVGGVGNWVICLMKGSFPESGPVMSPPKRNAVGEKGKKTRGPKRYVPQKNSAAYAILITLYREMTTGKSFMKKQELFDATEATGLSRYAIRPDKSKAKPGSFQNSQKDWYTGWSCMKTLTSKGLVVRLGNPAKYMLSEEGKYTARDCLSKSGLDDPAGSLMTTNALNTSTSNCCEKIVLSDSDSDEPYKVNSPLIGSEKITKRSGLPKLKSRSSSSLDISKGPTTNFGASDCLFSISPLSSQGTFKLQSFSRMGSTEFNMLDKDTVYIDNSMLAMPPGQSNEKFLEAYEVVLILDDREIFRSRSRRVADNIHAQFHVPVEIKRLPVGDGIWIARDRKLHTEYVLDFIVERKNVTDLLSSITDNRYREQKLRLKRCGLRKLIYLVEGEPNPLDASKSIKTACFTTEILDGFDVQRTTGYSDSERTYGYLTHSIIKYYSTNFFIGANTSRGCLTYEEFVEKCSDLEKITVSDVFALQLMQVPQVTEEVVLSVIELYPTLFSLAQAYSVLDGDTLAQEELLKNKSNMVNAQASRNVFEFIWGEG